MNKITDATSLMAITNAMQVHTIGTIISAISESSTQGKAIDPNLQNVIPEMKEFADNFFDYLRYLTSQIDNALIDTKKDEVEIIARAVKQFMFLENLSFSFAKNEKGERFILIPLWMMYFLPDEYTLLKFEVDRPGDGSFYLIGANKSTIIKSYTEVKRKDIEVEKFYEAVPKYGVCITGKENKEN